MAELPASWNLKTKRRDDGKLDIVGKDDNGHDYRVRTTDTSEVSEKDVQELKRADRESYPNPATRTYEYVKYLTENPAKAEQEKKFADDLEETSARVIRECTSSGAATNPGMIDMPMTMGYSHIPDWRWEMAFKDLKEN